MRGGDHQCVPVPFPGRESLPGMARVLRGMGSAVHPDRLFGAIGGEVGVIGNDLLGRRVHLLPDAEVGGPPPAVVRSMCAALVFGQFDQCGIPAVAPQPRCIIDRQAEVVADLRSGDALEAVFVEARRPLSRRVHLGLCHGTEPQAQQGNYRPGSHPAPPRAAHSFPLRVAAHDALRIPAPLLSQIHVAAV